MNKEFIYETGGRIKFIYQKINIIQNICSELLKTMNWDQVQIFHKNPPITKDNFQRTSEISEMYSKHIQDLKSQNIDLSAHIFQQNFYDPQTIKRGWNLKLNPYPYHLASNIKHYVLWIYPGIKLSETKISMILNKFIEKLRAQDWIYFQNIPTNRSVPDIDHYQVFIKLV